MNKDLIQARFSKSLASYNDNACIQKQMAENLTECLGRNNYNRVLELGCGTGFLTSLLNEKLSFESYKAIDIVKECFSYIANINPKIEFIQADIEDYLSNNKEKYDLIVSNAALQWIEGFEDLVKLLEKQLAPNGELVFSTFGNENFKEIYQITGKTLEYYTISELSSLFPGSEISSELCVMDFDSPKDVLKHLQLTGVNAIESKMWTKKDLLIFENSYRNICQERFSLTYNPVYIRYSLNSK